MLLPFEKALAVVAFGQMLRVSADFLGFWGFVRARVPPPPSSEDADDADAEAAPAGAGQPILFFDIKADGTPRARPEAHELLQRLLLLRTTTTTPAAAAAAV